MWTPGSMRMLMDGRLVAMPEEERRLMRTAAAAAAACTEQNPPLAALHGTEGKPRAGRSHRATSDSETHGRGTPDAAPVWPVRISTGSKGGVSGSGAPLPWGL